MVAVFGLAFMVGCSGGNEFKKFSEALPRLQTPMQFDNSGLIEHSSTKTTDAVAFEKFAPRGTNEAVGVLYEDEKTTSILYLRIGDINAPILMTYSNEGVKLDSMEVFNLDESLQGADVKRLVTFLPDRKIQIIDSVLIWTEIFNEGEPDITEATRVQQLSMDTVLRTIDANGKITKQ